MEPKEREAATLHLQGYTSKQHTQQEFRRTR